MAHNVKHEIQGDELVIRIKIDKEIVGKAEPSSSGKSVLVGSTSGYTSLDLEVGGVKLSYSAMVIGVIPKAKR